MNMSKTITQNDLLFYVYEKENVHRRGDMELSLLFDKEVFKQERELQMMKELIDESRICPKISTLKNILAYSKALQ